MKGCNICSNWYDHSKTKLNLNILIMSYSITSGSFLYSHNIKPNFFKINMMFHAITIHSFLKLSEFWFSNSFFCCSKNFASSILYFCKNCESLIKRDDINFSKSSKFIVCCENLVSLWLKILYCNNFSHISESFCRQFTVKSYRVLYNND